MIFFALEVVESSVKGRSSMADDFYLLTSRCGFLYVSRADMTDDIQVVTFTPLTLYEYTLIFQSIICTGAFLLIKPPCN